MSRALCMARSVWPRAHCRVPCSVGVRCQACLRECPNGRVRFPASARQKHRDRSSSVDRVEESRHNTHASCDRKSCTLVYGRVPINRHRPDRWKSASQEARCGRSRRGTQRSIHPFPRVRRNGTRSLIDAERPTRAGIPSTSQIESRDKRMGPCLVTNGGGCAKLPEPGHSKFGDLFSAHRSRQHSRE